MKSIYSNKSRLVVFLVLWLMGANTVRAVDGLSYLPEDVLSFAMVRNVQAANDKIVKFVGVFHDGLPAPLEMVQAMTGLSAGLNLEGDLLFGLLPSSEPGVPAPMFLLPVIDYNAFAEAMKADATGEICRITVANQDVLVAKRADFAVVMNLEHRELMQKVLAQPEKTPAAVAELTEWLAVNDIAIVVSPAGIAYIAEQNKRQLEDTDATEVPSQPSAIPNDMLTLGDDLPFAEFFRENVQSAALGMAIDDDINARVRWHVQFQQPIAEAKLTEVEDAEKPLTGFAAKPYVVAGGGPVPLGTGTWLPELFTNISRTMATQDGRDDFTEADWQEVQHSYELAVADLQKVSYLITTGKEGEPLLSVVFARLTVADSAKYMQSLKELFDLSNKLIQRSKSDIKLVYEIADTEIAGAKGIEVTCDLDEAAGDGDNIIWQTMLTSLLGIDHKLSLYFVTADDSHIFFGIESSEKLESFIADFKKQDPGLSKDHQVQTTLKLTDVEADWVGLLNPEGLMTLVKNALKSMMLLGSFPELPEYPSAPPLALTMNGGDVAWSGEIVLPVEASKAMSKFTKEVEQMFAH